ncbi:MAG: T9SS type A sorting domain-containing protein, partial [Bacteroidota bacterium]
TDALGCYETRSFTLSDPYVISFGGIMSPACPGGANGMATVNSSGCPCQFSTCTFLWDNGVTTKPNSTLTSGWHTVTIHHPSGCVVVDSVLIPEPLPIIIDTQIVHNTCFGEGSGSIELINSNYQPVVYNWSNGDNTLVSDGLSAGYYSVIVSDARGCIDSLEFSITEPAELVVTTVVTNILCNGDANGEILIQGQGGTGNYTYWMDQQVTNSSNSNLTAGIYEVYLTDENNCSSQIENITLSEPQSLNATITSTPQIISLDGTATVNVTGGTAPYSYEWDDMNSQTESMAVYLNSGWYSVNVTDANGCQLTDSVFVGTNVGIEDLTQNNLVLYPNPVKSILSIKGNGIALRLYDLNGKIISSSPFTTLLDISSLTNGVYTIEVEFSNNTSKRMRFTKID